MPLLFLLLLHLLIAGLALLACGVKKKRDDSTARVNIADSKSASASNNAETPQPEGGVIQDKSKPRQSDVKKCDSLAKTDKLSGTPAEKVVKDDAEGSKSKASKKDKEEKSEKKPEKDKTAEETAEKTKYNLTEYMDAKDEKTDKDVVGKSNKKDTEVKKIDKKEAGKKKDDKTVAADKTAVPAPATAKEVAEPAKKEKEKSPVKDAPESAKKEKSKSPVKESAKSSKKEAEVKKEEKIDASQVSTVLKQPETEGKTVDIDAALASTPPTCKSTKKMSNKRSEPRSASKAEPTIQKTQQSMDTRKKTKASKVGLNATQATERSSFFNAQ